MKALRKILLYSLISTASLTAEPDGESYNDFITQFSIDKDSEEFPSFFEIKGNIDVTGQGKIKSFPYEGEKLRFSEWQSNAYYTFPCFYRTALSIGGGYSDTAVIWRQNPFFRETHYNNLITSINLFSEAICDWTWQGGFSIAVDTDAWNWADYALYTTTIWGRYDYCDYLGLHIGFVEQSGIEKDRIFPIIGFDYQLFDCWKLNLVYPVNMSLVYTINDAWSVAFAGRVFNSRHRVGKDEPLSRGIFEYRNTGAEFGVSYTPGDFASANIHVGSALGGDLKVSNRHDHHSVHVKINSVIYAGGAIQFRF